MFPDFIVGDKLVPYDLFNDLFNLLYILLCYHKNIIYRKGYHWMTDDFERQALQDFEKKVKILERKYQAAMKTLTDIPNQLSKDRLKETEEEVAVKIKVKMVELGRQFDQNMNMLAEELVNRISGTGV